MCAAAALRSQTRDEIFDLMHKLVLIHRLNLCSRSGMRNLFKMHAQALCIMQMHSHVEHRAHQNATTTSDHRDVIIASCPPQHCIVDAMLQQNDAHAIK